ncbi:MAG: hypothetical protein ABIR56_11465, partial [Polaromonas sp.]
RCNNPGNSSMSPTANTVLSAADTALALPYPALAGQIEALLRDSTVAVPARIVQALRGGGSLFVMPAAEARVAITKLITFTPHTAARDRVGPSGQTGMEAGSRRHGGPAASLSSHAPT